VPEINIAEVYRDLFGITAGSGPELVHVARHRSTIPLPSIWMVYGSRTRVSKYRRMNRRTVIATCIGGTGAQAIRNDGLGPVAFSPLDEGVSMQDKERIRRRARNRGAEGPARGAPREHCA
jgi:hypothetical protein